MLEFHPCSLAKLATIQTCHLPGRLQDQSHVSSATKDQTKTKHLKEKVPLSVGLLKRFLYKIQVSVRWRKLTWTLREPHTEELYNCFDFCVISRCFTIFHLRRFEESFYFCHPIRSASSAQALVRSEVILARQVYIASRYIGQQTKSTFCFAFCEKKAQELQQKAQLFLSTGLLTPFSSEQIRSEQPIDKQKVANHRSDDIYELPSICECAQWDENHALRLISRLIVVYFKEFVWRFWGFWLFNAVHYQVLTDWEFI